MDVRKNDQEKQKTNKRYDSKPWFTNACNRARAKYRNSKKHFFFTKCTKNSYNNYKDNEEEILKNS